MPRAALPSRSRSAAALPENLPATLELVLPPRRLPRLLRSQALADLCRGRARGGRLHLAWYDSPDGSLTLGGLALEVWSRRQGARQVLRRTLPAANEFWLPGAAGTILAEATPRAVPDPEAAGLPAGTALIALATADGRWRALDLMHEGEAAQLCFLWGRLQGGTAEAPFLRLQLSAPPAVALALAARLAVATPLLPALPLAETARGLALGAPPRPARQGAPALTSTLTVEEGFAQAVSHLAAMLVALVPQVAAGQDVEAVHQMRVALRRLRSAFAI